MSASPAVLARRTLGMLAYDATYAAPVERGNFEIAGAGYGIHWPDLDEDIGVDGLLLGKRSTESQASFARWLARRQQV